MGTSSGITFYERGIIDKVLQNNNNFRAKHGSPDLELSDTLCKKAENVVKQLSDDRKDKKEDDDSLFIYHNEPLGVNIYYNKEKKSPEDICQKWYDENSNYKYGSDKFQKDAIHFTQMIWKKTKKVGFAFNKKNKNCYGVALYYPAGNIFGEFQENVMPKK